MVRAGEAGWTARPLPVSRRTAAAFQARPSAGDGCRRADLTFEDLARRPLRELVDEPDMARVLVRRDALLDEGAKLVGLQGLALLERDGRSDLLAERLVRDAHDGGFPDARVLVEDLLDLARGHVVAAADDQVLLAVDDEEVTVLVDTGHVAGVEPAAAHGLLGRVRALPVAPHDIVA